MSITPSHQTVEKPSCDESVPLPIGVSSIDLQTVPQVGVRTSAATEFVRSFVNRFFSRSAPVANYDRVSRCHTAPPALYGKYDTTLGCDHAGDVAVSPRALCALQEASTRGVSSREVSSGIASFIASRSAISLDDGPRVSRAVFGTVAIVEALLYAAILSFIVMQIRSARQFMRPLSWGNSSLIVTLTFPFAACFSSTLGEMGCGARAVIGSKLTVGFLWIGAFMCSTGWISELNRSALLLVIKMLLLIAISVALLMQRRSVSIRAVLAYLAVSAAAFPCVCECLTELGQADIIFGSVCQVSVRTREARCTLSDFGRDSLPLSLIDNFADVARSYNITCNGDATRIDTSLGTQLAARYFRHQEASYTLNLAVSVLNALLVTIHHFEFGELSFETVEKLKATVSEMLFVCSLIVVEGSAVMLMVRRTDSFEWLHTSSAIVFVLSSLFALHFPSERVQKTDNISQHSASNRGNKQRSFWLFISAAAALSSIAAVSIAMVYDGSPWMLLLVHLACNLTCAAAQKVVAAVNAAPCEAVSELSVRSLAYSRTAEHLWNAMLFCLGAAPVIKRVMGGSGNQSPSWAFIQTVSLCSLPCGSTFFLWHFRQQLQSFAESRQAAIALLRGSSCMLFLLLMWAAEIYVALDLRLQSDDQGDGISNEGNNGALRRSHRKGAASGAISLEISLATFAVAVVLPAALAIAAKLSIQRAQTAGLSRREELMVAIIVITFVIGCIFESQQPQGALPIFHVCIALCVLSAGMVLKLRRSHHDQTDTNGGAARSLQFCLAGVSFLQVVSFWSLTWCFATTYWVPPRQAGFVLVGPIMTVWPFFVVMLSLCKALQNRGKRGHAWIVLSVPLQQFIALLLVAYFDSYPVPHNFKSGAIMVALEYVAAGPIFLHMWRCESINFEVLSWQYMGFLFLPLGAALRCLALKYQCQELGRSAGEVPIPVLQTVNATLRRGAAFQDHFGLAHGLVAWEDYESAYANYLKYLSENVAIVPCLQLPLYWVPCTHFSLARVTSGTIRCLEVLTVFSLVSFTFSILLMHGLSTNLSKFVSVAMCIFHGVVLWITLWSHRDSNIDPSHWTASLTRLHQRPDGDHHGGNFIEDQMEHAAPIQRVDSNAADQL